MGTSSSSIRSVNLRKAIGLGSNTRFFPESFDIAQSREFACVLSKDILFFIPNVLSSKSRSATAIRSEHLKDARSVSISPCESYCVVANCGEGNVAFVQLCKPWGRQGFFRTRTRYAQALELGNISVFPGRDTDSPLLGHPIDIAYAKYKDSSLIGHILFVLDYSKKCVFKLEIGDDIRVLGTFAFGHTGMDQPTSISVSPGNDFALIGSGKSGGRSICVLNLRTGSCCLATSPIFCRPEGRALIAPDGSFALVPSADSDSIAKVRIDPKNGAVEVLRVFRGKHLHGPLSGAFATCYEKENLVALVPNELGGDLCAISFPGELTDVRRVQKDRIYRVAIWLRQHRALKRGVVLSLLCYVPRLGLADLMRPQDSAFGHVRQLDRKGKNRGDKKLSWSHRKVRSGTRRWGDCSMFRTLKKRLSPRQKGRLKRDSPWARRGLRNRTGYF